MAIPLKISGGAIQQFAGADALDINSILPRSGTAIQIGGVGDTVTIGGDLQVDGTETVTSTATFNGDVNLGDGSGDTIDVGGGGSDVVNLQNDLTVGAGAVSIGSSVTDYLLDLWLDIVAGSPADGTNAAVEIGANATRLLAGANSVGVGTANLTNSSPSNGDLQTVLEALDAAIGAGGGTTLQTAYVAGNTISVTTANGSVALSNTTDTQDVLTVDVSGAGSGNAVTLTDGTNTTVMNAGTIENDGGDMTISTAANGAGDGYDIDLLAGTGTTEGGDISILAGGGTAGSGGDVAIAAANGTTAGGDMALFTGDATAALGAGGSMTINIGDGFGGVTTSPGAGGAYTLTGGAGGDATDTAGFGASGGAVSLTAGAGGAGDAGGSGGAGSGGALILRAGAPGEDSGGTPGSGGNVLIEGGNSSGTTGGAAGSVNINTTAGTGSTTIGNATDHGSIALVGPTTVSYTATGGSPALGISTDTTAHVLAMTGTLKNATINYVEQILLSEIGAGVPSVSILSVDGTPNGNVTAAAGSIALGNSTVYVNTDGSTAWTDLGAGASSLQEAYEGGNTIDVTSGEGSVTIDNATDDTDLLTLTRTFGGLGDALAISMAVAATGHAISITDAAITADLTIDPAIVEHTAAGQTFTIRNATGTATAGNILIAGGTLPTAGAGGSVSLQGGQGTSGGELDFDAGPGIGTGAGGAVNIDAGIGGATGVGGDMRLSAGRGGGTSGNGGALRLLAGNAFSGTSLGGLVEISGGNGTGTGFGGTVTINGGDATGSNGLGGSIDLIAGTGIGTTGDGGDIDILGGPASGASAEGGNVLMRGGNNSANNGGSVFIRGGLGGGGGVDGSIAIGDSTTASIASGPAGGNIRWSHRGIMDLAAPSTDDGGIDIFEAIELNSTGTGAQTASIIIGNGNPNGVVTSGDVGSLFINAANAALYQKTAAGTTWVAFASGGGNSLQQAYDAGPAITTDGSGAVEITKADGSANTEELLTLEDFDDAAATNTMLIDKSPAVAATGGDALNINLGANSSGNGIQIVDGGAGSNGLLINKTGSSGNAIEIQDGGTTVFNITAQGDIVSAPSAGRAFNVDTTGAGAISLDSAAASNFTVSGATADLTFGARGSTITLNESGETSLDGAFSATSIIGALNELAAGGVSGQQTVSLPIENGVTIAAGDVVAAGTTSGRVELMNANGDANGNFVGICVTGGTGDAGGTVDAVIAYAGLVTGLTGLTAQAPAYAPDGTGAPTSTPPANSGDLVFRVGFAISTTQMIIQAGEGIVL